MKVSRKAMMKSMDVGTKISFPIKSRDAIRNTVSNLNTENYLDGKKWISESYKEEGIVVVQRLS